MTTTPPTYEVTPQWATFLDVQEDVRPWLLMSDTPEVEIDKRLRMVTQAICQRVQNYLGKPIGETQFFRRFSGWPGYNGAILALPYYPVLEVKRVVEFRGTGGPFELTQQTPESQGQGETFQLEALEGLLIRTFTGNIQRPWFPGSKNIEVTWTAGYDPIPADIKLATLDYIKRWWDSTQQSARKGAPAGSLGDAGPSTAGSWGDLQRTLDTYAQQGMG